MVRTKPELLSFTNLFHLIQFALILPTHGRANFLPTAVRSVLAQSYPHWQLWIVLDGADLATETACVPFLSDARVHLLVQENAGPGAARRRGLEAAAADFCCFLDDDDYWLPQHLENLADAIEQKGDYQALYRSGMYAQWPDGSRQALPLYDHVQDALAQYWQAPSNLLAYAVPYSAALACPIDSSKRIIEDFEWMSRLLLYYNCYQLPHYTAVNVQHQNNRTNLLRDQSYLHERLATVQALYQIPELQVRVPRNTYRRLLAHQCFHFSRQSAQQGAFRLALKAFKKGFHHGGRVSAREGLYTLAFGVKSWLAAALR